DFFENFFEPFDPDWLNTFPIGIQHMALSQMTTKAVGQMESAQEFEDFLLHQKWLEDPKKKEFGHSILDYIKTRQGKFEETRKLTDQEDFSAMQLLRKGTTSFFLGQNEFAIKAFEGGM